MRRHDLDLGAFGTVTLILAMAREIRRKNYGGLLIVVTMMTEIENFYNCDVTIKPRGISYWQWTGKVRKYYGGLLIVAIMVNGNHHKRPAVSLFKTQNQNFIKNMLV